MNALTLGAKFTSMSGNAVNQQGARLADTIMKRMATISICAMVVLRMLLKVGCFHESNSNNKNG